MKKKCEHKNIELIAHFYCYDCDKTFEVVEKYKAIKTISIGKEVKNNKE